MEGTDGDVTYAHLYQCNMGSHNIRCIGQHSMHLPLLESQILLLLITFVPPGVINSIPLLSNSSILDNVGGRRMSIGGLHGPSHSAATMTFSASILMFGGSEVVVTSAGHNVCPSKNQHNVPSH